MKAPLITIENIGIGGDIITLQAIGNSAHKAEKNVGHWLWDGGSVIAFDNKDRILL